MKQQAKKSQEVQQEKKLQETPEAHRARATEAHRARAAEAKADERDRGRITSITIENFKGISNAVEIPIRPITLLFGKNSSGKSTVLQALRYHYFFREIELEIRRGNKPDSQIEMAGGHNIDLTDFYSLVHRNDLDKKIRVRITYAPKKESEKSYILWEEVITGWRENPHPDKPRPKNTTHIESILLGCKINNEERCFITSGEKPDDTVVGSNCEKLEPIKLEHKPGDPPEEEIALMRLDEDFVNTTLGDTIKEPKKLDDIRHLGPFREVPFDDDKGSQMTDKFRWEKGAGAWEAIKQNSKLLEQTNSYMQKKMNLRYSINQLQPQSTKLLHYKDNDEDNGIDVGLSDVGIGISQLIPVVVGALDNSQNYGIFAVQQPELHLHPALQVALGDVFIDAIKDNNNNRTILIETHSEHLVLRLLRRVHETSSKRVKTEYTLTPDDLSVVVQSTPEGEFASVSVTKDGDFDEPWPEGFFEERDSELFYHA